MRHRGAGAAQARERAQHELLVQLGRAAVDRAADEVGVLRPRGRAARRRGGRARGSRKPGATRSSSASMRSAIASRSRSSQRARDPVAAGVAADLARHVRVAPERLGARGLARRVHARVLARDQERPLGHLARGDPGHRQRQRVDRLGDVHGARPRHLRARPRHRAVERPVDLDGAVVVLEAPQPLAHARPAGARRRRGARRAAGRRRRPARRAGRRARARRPCARRPRARRAGPPARPGRRTRSGPPAAARRRTSAAVSAPEPPSGTG